MRAEGGREGVKVVAFRFTKLAYLLGKMIMINRKVMGLTMTAALNLFINKVTMERRILFEITADPDPFYSNSNIRYLEEKMSDYKAGRLKLSAHDLLED